jgi:hypothetical protein
MYFNTRQQLSGHLLQGRFHTSPTDEDHLWAAVRYHTPLSAQAPGCVCVFTRGQDARAPRFDAL